MSKKNEVILPFNDVFQELLRDRIPSRNKKH